MSNLEGLEVVICLVIFPKANQHAHCLGWHATSCCVEFLLLQRGLTPTCGMQCMACVVGQECWEQSHLFVAGNRLQGGVQEQGGFRVRVFPEYLPSFW